MVEAGVQGPDAVGEVAAEDGGCGLGAGGVDGGLGHVELGVEVVEDVDGDGFGGRGDLGGAELELAVVGEDDVVQDDEELFGDGCAGVGAGAGFVLEPE